MLQREPNSRPFPLRRLLVRQPGNPRRMATTTCFSNLPASSRRWRSRESACPWGILQPFTRSQTLRRWLSMRMMFGAFCWRRRRLLWETSMRSFVWGLVSVQRRKLCHLTKRWGPKISLTFSSGCLAHMLQNLPGSFTFHGIEAKRTKWFPGPQTLLI